MFRKRNDKELDIGKINSLVLLGNKVFQILLVMLIVAGVYIGIKVLKELQIFPFILTILKLLLPLFIGLFIAWLLDPIVSKLKEKGIRRGFGTAICYIVFLGIVFLIVNALIPLLSEQINEFVSNTIPGVYDACRNWINNIFDKFNGIENFDANSMKLELFTKLESIATNLTSSLPAILVTFVTNLFSGVGTFAIGMIIGFYILLDFDKHVKLIYSLVPNHLQKDAYTLVKVVDEPLKRFVIGAIIDCSVVFIISFIGFAIIGLKAPLLFGLFCVAGNISLDGDLVGSPRVNTIILLIGTFLSSLIGTTGASMLLVRPIIKMNSWRHRRSHIMIFFIFLISNMGGCLTPIGDPPLLMGFMRGVPFTWSIHLLPVLCFNLLVLLPVFYMIDRKNYRLDIAEGSVPDISKESTELKFHGGHNVIFIITIVIAVVLSGTLSNVPAFIGADGVLKGLHIGEVTFSFVTMIEIAIILLSAFLSFKTTKKEIRTKNHFNWGAIKEVAILFIGIFITMQPALIILKAVGPTLGISKAWQMFWTTGALSSFLDNTPTYLVFFTTAGTLGFTSGITTSVGVITAKVLMSISCGAVFMGAGTYIGNAPNFMVKSIADENGVRMPGFFGYMIWSIGILVPVFILDTLIFFL